MAKKAPGAGAADALPKLASPALRALASARCKSLRDVAKLTESEAIALHGMGPNAMSKLKAALKAAGLSFPK